jgi:N-acetyl sugar amidotransferase
MHKIHYCRLCLYPDTKPHLFFNNKGICYACINFNNRSKIDWINRKESFIKLVKTIKRNSNANHDCIIPVSGGKDSTYQVIRCLEYGLKPLCVTATTDDLSLLGESNLDNIKKLGVDCIEVTVNPNIRRKINKFTLKMVGDISWSEHLLIFTIPVRIAINFNIKLIVWGENSQNEYGGPENESKKNILDNRWLQEFGGLGGLRVRDLVDSDEFKKEDLLLYQYPSVKELKKSKVMGIFLGHYFPWDGYENKIIAEKHGFKAWPKDIEGSLLNYENIDNYQHGIHDYFCFLKFGFGRATAQASILIRRNRILRSEALKKIKEMEGKFPWSYLDKKLSDILKSIEMTQEEFIDTCDKFTNKKIFHINKDGSLLKDNTLSLKKINYDN